MYKVWVNKSKGETTSRFISAKQLLKMLVDIAGGGMTTSQTMKAMTYKNRLDFVNRQNDYDILTLNYHNNKIHFRKTNQHPEQELNEFFAGNTTLENGVIDSKLKPLKTARLGKTAYSIEGNDLTNEYGNNLKPLFINNSESKHYEQIMKGLK